MSGSKQKELRRNAKAVYEKMDKIRAEFSERVRTEADRDKRAMTKLTIKCMELAVEEKVTPDELVGMLCGKVTEFTHGFGMDPMEAISCLTECFLHSPYRQEAEEKRKEAEQNGN